MNSPKDWVENLTPKQKKEIKDNLQHGDNQKIIALLKKKGVAVSDYDVSRAFGDLTIKSSNIYEAAIIIAKKNGLDIDKLLNL